MRQRERRFILDSVPRPKPGQPNYNASPLTLFGWLRIVCNGPVIAIIISHMAYVLLCCTVVTRQLIVVSQLFRVDVCLYHHDARLSQTIPFISND